MEKITSKDNKLIKNTKRLFTSRKARIQNNEFVLEGARLCFDVLNSSYIINYFLITEKCFEKYNAQSKLLIEKAKESYFITDDLAKKIAETESTQGVFVVCKAKESKANIDFSKKYIALDNLQDPANLGAIVRTAEALGINGAITYNSCDIYNPKSLRASMGSLLRMNIIESENLVDTIELCKTNGMKVYATVPDSNAKDIREADFSGGVIAVIGNEGNGISDEVKSVCDLRITIKMLGLAESLNASMAGAITMWEMLRGGHSEK